ncbi:Cys-rich peptide radical SAM maturase CcpM [Paenibacillus sp. FSL H7-0918]|uniref:Cys-rich peptide radical SAM maturase CcpM n=1 Tax=Paenibacillus sp. FSL H7-0918 TaxID=2921442 RepID=UPI0030F928E6
MALLKKLSCFTFRVGGVQVPVFHLFETVTGKYMFDANANTFLKLNERSYQALLNYRNSNFEQVEPEIQNLLDSGFLAEKQDFEMIHPMSDSLQHNLSRSVGSITLQVTQNCNLRCSYCAYSGSYLHRVHTNKRMKKEVALKAIKFLIEHSVDSPIINIGFYGGEPLLEMDLIKACVAYAREQSAGKELTFNLTTNATLITDETLEFLSSNDFNLTISLDGDEVAHDRNRVFAVNNKGSFQTIMDNIENIKNKTPDYVDKVMFNAVIDPNSDFSCSTNFFSNYETVKDFAVMASDIASSYKKSESLINDSFIKMYNYEVFKLFLYKFDRLKKNDVSKLVMESFDQIQENVHNRLRISFYDVKKDHHSGPCVPGVQRLFVNADGALYPCERVSEASSVMRIGHIDTGFELDNIRNILNIGTITEKECKECWAFRYCTSCAMAADDISEFSAAKKLSICNKVKENTESLFKDYCVLRELGYDFDKEKV